MRKNSIILYFLLACLISWLAKLFMVSEDTGQIPVIVPKGFLQLIAKFGPSLAALVMIFSERGKKGLFGLFRNITGMNFHFKWLPVVLFFELFLFHVILLVCVVSGYGNVKFQSNLVIPGYFNFFLNTAVLSVLTGLGEEIGWRGYLLPRLQLKYRIILAAMILSLLNSLWHIRTDCIALVLQGDFSRFAGIYFPDMGLRILITIPVVFFQIFVFNETRGSLFLMILFHGSANASYEWVKEMTGNPSPEFILPYFAAILWISAIYFVPAVLSQARNNKLVTKIF